MKKTEIKEKESNVLAGIIAGFVLLMLIFKLLGSSFNELLTLGLFFMVITIIISSLIWTKDAKK